MNKILLPQTFYSLVITTDLAITVDFTRSSKNLNIMRTYLSHLAVSNFMHKERTSLSFIQHVSKTSIVCPKRQIKFGKKIVYILLSNLFFFGQTIDVFEHLGCFWLFSTASSTLNITHL